MKSKARVEVIVYLNTLLSLGMLQYPNMGKRFSKRHRQQYFEASRINLNYLVVIEKAKGNYSSYSPDVLGCISAGDTIEETRQNMKDALQAHIQGMVEDGEGIPQPKGFQSYQEAQENSAGEYYLCHIEVEFELEEVA